MRSHTLAGVAGAAIFAVGAAAGAAALSRFGTASAEDRSPSFPGLYVSHEAEDRFDMSVGRTAADTPKNPDRRYEERLHLTVPDFYGDAVGITQHESRSILWFRDDGGALRNVVIEDAGEQALQVDRGATTKREQKIR